MIKNIIISNYNEYKLLTLSQKIKEPLNTSRDWYIHITYYIFVCLIEKRKGKRKTKDGRPNAPSPSCPG